jgi:methyl halide transferase
VDGHRPEVSTPQYWDELYESGGDGWELGAPAPPLVAWLDAGGRFPARGDEPARVAVPGCGRGHDARLLAGRVNQVWGFDFAAAAVTAARVLAERERLDVTFVARDLFTLGADYARFFDGAWEYTCFCAIDPARRDEYARLLHAVLRPGGILLACFFPLREAGGGPPFAVSAREVERVLAPYFDIRESGPPARSAEGRQGLELLVRAARRP